MNQVNEFGKLSEFVNKGKINLKFFYSLVTFFLKRY